ncbi:ABC-type Mn2+/Zn2+ transport system permease subunit [Actinoplanes octamycinicus]|uniref:ABC-type Mn2+/Zn2+ transport system permease subunit n=1 Tax=Actinoplanes octamycinicus TaxID=135948 RepID=A0A7W7H6Z8_9ACTN|nr:metal ABC transporter permease [Actinoplanes octamycinicus]MBB4745019.1 ABC-type Mn2+/Zn2+ transport system permease subunit [Actinoplanes octamycinicus]
MTAFTVPFMGRALAELLLLGLVCGPVGFFVFARRLSFTADALTHTVFPGVVIGFLAGGASGLLAGALTAALLTAVVLTLITRRGGVTDDAATAVLLTSMFAIGVALVSRKPSYTADLTAFLFGRLLTVSPAQVAATAVLVALILAGLAMLARALLFRAFDPAGAAAAGYRASWLDLWLNVLVALVVVATVQAVGTILVVALLVVPPAAARLVSTRPIPIVLLSTALILLAGPLGLWLSWTASVDHGVPLGAAPTVVLLLVLAYLLALATAALRRAPAAAETRPTPLSAVGCRVSAGPEGCLVGPEGPVSPSRASAPGGVSVRSAVGCRVSAGAEGCLVGPEAPVSPSRASAPGGVSVRSAVGCRVSAGAEGCLVGPEAPVSPSRASAPGGVSVRSAVGCRVSAGAEGCLAGAEAPVRASRPPVPAGGAGPDGPVGVAGLDGTAGCAGQDGSLGGGRTAASGGSGGRAGVSAGRTA